MLNNNYAKQNKLYKIAKLIFFILAMLVPMIPMMYLYQKNADYVLLSHMMVAASVMVVASAGAYGILLLLYKSTVSALTGIIIAWIIFFGYGIIYGYVNSLGIRHRHLLPVTFAVMVAVLFMLKQIAVKCKTSFGSGKNAILIMCMVLSILLLWNISGALITFRNVHKYDGMQNDLVRTSINIDDSITNLPNIYWLHCDGMLGFEPLEKYFGDSQTEFLRFLTGNGFMVNRHANFEAGHQTVQAVPTLMCPGYYDAVIEGIGQGIPEMKLLNPRMMYVARMKNETIQAFTEKKYKTVLISPLGIYFPPTTDFLYDYSSYSPLIMGSDLQNSDVNEIISKIDNIVNISNFSTLLVKTTMIGAISSFFDRIVYKINSIVNGNIDIAQRQEIPEYIEEAAKIQERDAVDPDSYGVIRCLLDSRNIEGPKFVVVNFLMAHRPFIYDENGNANQSDINAPESYPSHHRYAAKVLKNIISAILEREPDAVIVLQADHGLHGLTRKQILKSFDGSEASVTDIWNSTMSAVRIPEQYGTPDEILEPLDISRYLVNNYVGYNYEYWDYHR